MSYKIEIYHYGGKDKHKFYDSEETYNKWWKKRSDEAGWYKRINVEYGLVGYIDGKVDKVFGEVPNKFKVENNDNS